MNQVNRRDFLQYSAAGAFAATMTPTSLLANKTNTNSLPYTSLATHVLNRISFGINSESYNQFEQMGYKDYIDYQLNPESIDDSEIENYIAQNYPTVNMSTLEIFGLIQNETIGQFEAAEELRAATFLRAVYSKKQLLQVMTEFWNNHFSVYHFDGPIAFLKTKEDREVMRPLALSTFSEILHADAKSPSMVYYLDSFSSTKEAPNENYARELMELHTLGVDGPFNHHDIDEVARCFTGWQINNSNGDFRFNANNHDFDEKQVLGNTIIAGGGLSDGEQVINILAAQESTAAYLSEKLCRHFIADEPDKSIVESTTNVFISSNGDIKECLRHILLSKHFLISRDFKLKRPFAFMTSAVRSLNGNILNNEFHRLTQGILAVTGHLPFNWETPDGYPDKAGHWESTTGVLFRWNFINLFSYGALPGYSYLLEEFISEPHTPENILSQISEKIIFRSLLPIDEMTLLDYLSAGTGNSTVPILKIQGAIAIVLGSPYFQLS